MYVIYPAMFHQEDGSCWVEFPDLKGCETYADTPEKALSVANEALNAYCAVLLEEKRTLPKATPIAELNPNDCTFLSMIDTGVAENQKSVKKTLTIPAWLNAYAEEKHINFSRTLTEALTEIYQSNH